MGPMLMTGLALFAAAVANGLIASRTFPWPATTGPGSPVRTLAIVLMAYVEGIAVLAVVVGQLAIFLVGVPTDAGLLAAALAVVGSIVGIELIVLRWKAADRGITTIAVAFILGLGVLGLVIAVLALTVEMPDPSSVADAPFVVLGAATCGATLALGVTGANAMRSLVGVDLPRARTIYTQQLRRSFPLQAVAIGSLVVGLVLIAVH
jgi:F0F1-type ATP synthase membrane subunit c/vacuolar-type H+-ATPase subunit K